jgi:hypothetical protein
MCRTDPLQLFGSPGSSHGENLSSDDVLLIVPAGKYQTASTLVKNVTEVNKTFCPVLFATRKPSTPFRWLLT